MHKIILYTAPDILEMELEVEVVASCGSPMWSKSNV